MARRKTVLLGALLAAAVFAAYTACYRPNWFLAVLVGLPVLLDLTIPAISENTLTIGPVQVRPWDPGAIGLLIGILYRGGSQGLRALRRHHGGLSGAIIIFLIIKVAATVAFAGNTIASNGLSNTLGGGIVGAVGEVRDDLLALVVPAYVILSSRHLRISRMVAPFIFAIGIILLKAVLQVAESGQIWSGTGEARFIGASEAITLTILSFVIFFVPAARRRQRLLRSIACVGFGVAILSNNRSQWLASLVGIGVLLVFTSAGKLILLKDRGLRALCGLAVVAIVGVGVAIVYSGSALTQASDTTGLSSRMLAITSPDQDTNAAWRLQLWQARIEQNADHWVLGRFLGDRRLTLLRGSWLSVPNHNAYVTAFELGGVFLLGLMITFWGAVVIEAIRRLRGKGPTSTSWEPVAALAVIGVSLAFGVAYDFPSIGPALATALLLRKPKNLSMHPTSRLRLLQARYRGSAQVLRGCAEGQ